MERIRQLFGQKENKQTINEKNVSQNQSIQEIGENKTVTALTTNSETLSRQYVVVKKDGHDLEIVQPPEKKKCLGCKLFIVPTCLGISAYLLNLWSQTEHKYYGKQRRNFAISVFGSILLFSSFGISILFDFGNKNYKEPQTEK